MIYNPCIQSKNDLDGNLDWDLDRDPKDVHIVTGHSLFNTTKRITLLFIVWSLEHCNPPNILIKFIQIAIQIECLHAIQIECLHAIQIECLHTIQIECLHAIQIECLHAIQIECLHAIQIECLLMGQNRRNLDCDLDNFAPHKRFMLSYIYSSDRCIA